MSEMSDKTAVEVPKSPEPAAESAPKTDQKNVDFDPNASNAANAQGAEKTQNPAKPETPEAKQNPVKPETFEPAAKPEIAGPAAKPETAEKTENQPAKTDNVPATVPPEKNNTDFSPNSAPADLTKPVAPPMDRHPGLPEHAGDTLINHDAIAALPASERAQFDQVMAKVADENGRGLDTPPPRDPTARPDGDKDNPPDPARDPKLELNYPRNDGALNGQVSPGVIEKGQFVDRYGNDQGTYVAPAGTDFGARSMHPEAQAGPYTVMRAAEDIPTRQSVSTPYFGQEGLGTQHQLPTTVENLVNEGKLEVLYLRKELH